LPSGGTNLGAVGGVLNEPTGAGEFIANGVGSGPVLGCAGLVTSTSTVENLGRNFFAASVEDKPDRATNLKGRDR
jgi:hypothetical protein